MNLQMEYNRNIVIQRDLMLNYDGWGTPSIWAKAVK